MVVPLNESLSRLPRLFLSCFVNKITIFFLDITESLFINIITTLKGTQLYFFIYQPSRCGMVHFHEHEYNHYHKRTDFFFIYLSLLFCAFLILLKRYVLFVNHNVFKDFFTNILQDLFCLRLISFLFRLCSLCFNSLILVVLVLFLCIYFQFVYTFV